MARFKYEGRDAHSARKGVIVATNKREAAVKLKSQGIRVTSLTEQAETVLTKDIVIGKLIKRDQFIMFLRQFSTLLRAGVTILDAVRILGLQVESKPFKKVLSSVNDDLRAGSSLSDALAKHPKAFDLLVVNMIRAGEVSGTIDDSLDRLAIHYEKAHATRQKVITALSYPIIVGFLAIIVVIFLLTKIVPMFVEMFADMGEDLPLLTQFVMSASEFTVQYWYVFILLTVAVVAGFWFLKRSKNGQFLIDTFLLRLPLFGDIMKKSVLSTMTRTLSSLFSSSVPILQSLAMAEKVVGNEVISRVIAQSRRSLEKGGSLTEPMNNHWAFPPLIPHMIAIGEQTGSLDTMLAKVADFYEKEVDAATDRLKALIEPLMIIVLAGLVGTIVLAILMPMFGMLEDTGGM